MWAKISLIDRLKIAILDIQTDIEFSKAIREGRKSANAGVKFSSDPVASDTIEPQTMPELKEDKEDFKEEIASTIEK